MDFSGLGWNICCAAVEGTGQDRRLLIGQQGGGGEATVPAPGSPRSQVRLLQQQQELLEQQDDGRDAGSALLTYSLVMLDALVPPGIGGHPLPWWRESLYGPAVRSVLDVTTNRRVQFLVDFSCYFGVPLVDRTRTLPGPFLTQILDPIPEYDKDFAMTLPDICLARAEDVFNRADGRDIHVLWSGGIDSTAALVALLMVSEPINVSSDEQLGRGAAPPQSSGEAAAAAFANAAGWPSSAGAGAASRSSRRDQILVVYHSRAIEEYPLFHTTVVKGMRNREVCDSDEKCGAEGAQIGDAIDWDWDDVLGSGKRGHLTITGECGDQIFGSALLEWRFCSTPDGAQVGLKSGDELDAFAHLVHNPLQQHPLGLHAPWQETIIPHMVSECLAVPSPFTHHASLLHRAPQCHEVVLPPSHTCLPSPPPLCPSTAHHHIACADQPRGIVRGGPRGLDSVDQGPAVQVSPSVPYHNYL